MFYLKVEDLEDGEDGGPEGIIDVETLHGWSDFLGRLLLGLEERSGGEERRTC